MPAQQVFTFQVTTPANTPRTNPLITPLEMPAVLVDEVEIVIPDGHVGLTGIALDVGGEQVIPFGKDTWVIGNDEVLHWSLDARHFPGAWRARTFNEDETFSHSHYLRFLVRLPQEVGAEEPTRTPSLFSSGALAPRPMEGLRPPEMPEELGEAGGTLVLEGT